MKKPHEDTYFLDRDLAYQVALAHNAYRTADGQWLEQVCYYDGTPFEHAPDNLINVPAEKFNEYFESRLYRIPTHIEPTMGEQNSDPETIHQKLATILTAVQKLCRKNYDSKDAA